MNPTTQRIAAACSFLIASCGGATPATPTTVETAPAQIEAPTPAAQETPEVAAPVVAVEAPPPPPRACAAAAFDEHARVTRSAPAAGEAGPYTVDLVLCTWSGDAWHVGDVYHWGVEAVLTPTTGAARAVALASYQSDVVPNPQLGSCVGLVDSSGGTPPRMTPRMGTSLATCSFYIPGASDYFAITQTPAEVQAWTASRGEEGGSVPYTARGRWQLAAPATVGTPAAASAVPAQ